MCTEEEPDAMEEIIILEDCDVGSACDDGNPDTINDIYDSDCICSGEPVAQGLKPEFGTFTDPRDGKTYETFTLGDQEWFAENLDYRGLSQVDCYDDNPSYCGTYGVLYSVSWFDDAVPPGWHVPSNEEWTELFAAIHPGGAGASSERAKKMRSIGADYWLDLTDGTNESGFNGLPGGYNSGGSGWGLGRGAYFWSSTQTTPTSYYMFFLNNSVALLPNGTGKQISVRPIKD